MIFDGDRDELGFYIREIADRMGLRDWTIVVEDGNPDNPQHQAAIDTRYGRRFANIQFADDWTSLTPETLRQTCVHELLHCHLNPCRNVIDNIQSSIGTPLYNVTYNGLTDYLEVAIDSIATAWAETLPLPIKDETPDEEAA